MKEQHIEKAWIGITAKKHAPIWVVNNESNNNDDYNNNNNNNNNKKKKKKKKKTNNYNNYNNNNIQESIMYQFIKYQLRFFVSQSNIDCIDSHKVIILSVVF